MQIKKNGAFLTIASLCIVSGVGAQERTGPIATPPEPQGPVDSLATIEVAPFLLPPSSFSSPAAQTALADMRAVARSTSDHTAPLGVPEQRARREHELQPSVEEAMRLNPVTIVPSTVAGVPVDVVTPASGVATRNRRRVLIELAGGAFTIATRNGGLLESTPVAGLGGFRVISVHYRQGPEFKFPAASEDVAAVYGELLKTYRPSAIGIYGCSSGAYLTTMALAWFQTHNLPRPGAVALLCGSAGRIFEGDSYFTGAALMGRTAPRPVTRENPVVQVAYMQDTQATDPLAVPFDSPDVLAKFPPTLFITGTRDVALSSAVYLHSLLVDLGVKADLHVWDGMWHGFMNYPALPETRAAATVISKFFDQELQK